MGMQNNAKPKVSVVMSAYNSERYIGVAIESILGQTFTNFEFIIINDCSTDDTMTIINHYKMKDSRIIVIDNEKKQGLFRNRNYAIRKFARGKYVAIMDSDDIAEPDRLKEQVDFLEKNPTYGVCGSYLVIINDRGKDLGKRYYPVTDEAIRKYIFRVSPIADPVRCYRRDIYFKLNGYNESLSFASDYDLIFRAVPTCKLYNIPKFLLK